MFLGEDNHSLDGKGRLVMPSRHRRRLEDGCVVSKDEDGNLMVYPVDTYEDTVAARAMAMSDSREARRYRRTLFGAADMQTLDSSGRLLLRPELREWAGIDDSSAVVIVGVFDHLELWPEERWEHAKAQGDETFRDNDEEDEEPE